jgi:hypothetical protein
MASRQRISSMAGVVLAAAALLVGAGVVAASAGTVAADGSAVPAATAGCGKTPTLRNGTYTIQRGGESRTYILRIPDNY